MSDVRDLVGEISARFATLEADLARTRAELDEARRKVASYEGFDAELRETIAAAVAKAQEELLPRLVTLRDELARTELERDALRAEVGKLHDERSSLEHAVSELRPESSALRRASAEHLRGILNEVVAEMRKELAAVERPHEPRPATAPAAAPPAKPAPAPAAAAPTIPSAPVIPSAPITPPSPQPSRAAVEDVEEFMPRGGASPQAAPALTALQETDSHQIELVLRSVRSFPQLIAIENRIQSFPGVTRVYMHRTGVDGSATLTVQLEPQMDRDEFAAALGRNDRPQIKVDNVAGDQIEATVAQ
ncbi:MAG: hypothetical protein E6I87_01935 [Chloroflexi bacterium]|nr:MAG: hypothetical protein E6I87_01935 [Chloroflexota bacterium]